MAFSRMLEQAGLSPNAINTEASVTPDARCSAG